MLAYDYQTHLYALIIQGDVLDYNLAVRMQINVFKQLRIFQQLSDETTFGRKMDVKQWMSNGTEIRAKIIVEITDCIRDIYAEDSDCCPRHLYNR